MQATMRKQTSSFPDSWNVLKNPPLKLFLLQLLDKGILQIEKLFPDGVIWWNPSVIKHTFLAPSLALRQKTTQHPATYFNEEI